ncbi:MAG TPA: hypothetical protein VKA21_01630 [Candidatus Binatia bacterium]|nr:hypothetical protein [Candidatus Binatia bacterium]
MPSLYGGCCGNGVLDQGEQCDDHNTTLTDGCSAACQIEPEQTNCVATTPTVMLAAVRTADPDFDGMLGLAPGWD